MTERRWDTFWRLGVALVVVQAVVRLLIVRDGFYWQDDFLHLAQANGSDASGSFLFQDYNDHLEPAKFAIYGWIAGGTGLDFTVAAGLLVVLQLAASLSLLWCLRTLFGSHSLILLPFVAYLFTPLGLTSGTWLAAALEALPLQISMTLAIGCSIRYLRGDGNRWMAGAVAALMLGLAFWEKSLLVVPAVLVGYVCLELRGERAGVIARSVAQGWRLWLVLVAAAGGYVLLYVARVDVTSTSQPADGSAVELIDALVLRTLVPGMFGGPWRGDGALNTLAAYPADAVMVAGLGLLGLLVVTSLLLRRRAAVLPWVFAVGYVAVDLLLVGWGRSAYIDLVARDPRYITDALAIITLCVTAAFAPVPGRAGPAPSAIGRRLLSWATPPACAAVAAVLACGALFTTSQIVDQLRHQYARSFATTAVEAARLDPSMVLVDAPAPPVEVVAQPVSVVFGAAGLDVAFDQPTAHLEMLDGFGQPHPVQLIQPVVEARGPLPDCGWRIGRLGRDLVEIPDGDANRVLQIGYLSGSPTDLEVSVGADYQATVRVPSGLGTAFFPVGASSGQLRVVAVAESHPTTCVSDLTVGSPWPG